MTTDLGLRLVQDAKEKRLVAARVQEIEALTDTILGWLDGIGLSGVGSVAAPIRQKIHGISDPVVEQFDKGIARVLETVDKKVIEPVRERKGEVSVRAAVSVANEQLSEYAIQKVNGVSDRAREMVVHTVDRVLPCDGEGDNDSLAGPDPSSNDWLTIGAAVKTRASTKVSRTISHNLDAARDFSRERLPVDIMSLFDRSVDRLTVVSDNLSVAVGDTVSASREGLGHILKLDLFDVPTEITTVGMQAMGLAEVDDQHKHAIEVISKLLRSYLSVFDDSKSETAINNGF